MEIFDCYSSFGRRGVVAPGSFFSLADLLDRMDRYQISKALVYHSLAHEYDPATGNRILCEQIKDQPRLYPVWILLPHYTGELPEPRELLNQLRLQGVCAVRIFPAAADHDFALTDWSCGALLAALAEIRIPLFCDLGQISWDQVHWICSQYPQLPLVLTRLTYRINRHVYPLLKQHPNLYLETSGYKVFRGIEAICCRFGAERLLFGSGMPAHSGSAALALLQYARITPAEREAIAGRNLERLLAEVHYA